MSRFAFSLLASLFGDRGVREAESGSGLSRSIIDTTVLRFDIAELRGPSHRSII